jgi:parallel beta-helix repeat protein
MAADLNHLEQAMADVEMSTAAVIRINGVGDGVVDDTGAVQAAIDQAATAIGVPGVVYAEPGATYKVSRVMLRSNVTLDLQGATLRGSSASVTAVVESPALVSTGHIVNARLRNGIIDAANINYGCVWITDATNVVIEKITCLNLKPETSTAIRLDILTVDCVVRDCDVTLNPSATSSVGISCCSSVVDDQSGGQNDTLTFVEPTNLSQGHTITGNIVRDGTHGIAMVGAANILISNNQVTGQTHRGIILSPRAVDCRILGNSVREFVSTGIHMAWGCLRTIIIGNTVRTTRSATEGDGIKGYFGCNDTIVNSNYVSGVVNGGVRFAVGSDRFTITGNRIDVCKYGVLVQGSLDAPYYIPATGGVVNGGHIAGNMITAAGVASGEGIRIASLNADSVQRIGVFANQIIDVTYGLVLAEVTANRVNNIEAVGNSFTGSVILQSPRGVAHFRELSSNGPVISKVGALSLQFAETTDPPAPSTNNAALYVRDNGSGKTQLMVRFPTGAAVQVAIEP